MTTLKSIGSPRKVPGVHPRELESCLNLLAAFGGGSEKLHTLLEDLKAASSHNQKLLDDVTLALRRLNDLEDQKRKLDARQAEVDAKFLKLEKIQSDFAQYEADLAAGKFDA